MRYLHYKFLFEDDSVLLLELYDRKWLTACFDYSIFVLFIFKKILLQYPLMAGTKVYFKDILLTLTYVKIWYGWLTRTTSKLILTKLFRYVKLKKKEEKKRERNVSLSLQFIIYKI